MRKSPVILCMLLTLTFISGLGLTRAIDIGQTTLNYSNSLSYTDNRELNSSTYPNYVSNQSARNADLNWLEYNTNDTIDTEAQTWELNRDYSVWVENSGDLCSVEQTTILNHSNALVLTDANNSAGASVIRNITASGSTGTIEFWLWINTTTTARFYVIIGDTSASDSMYLRWSSGYFYYYDGGYHIITAFNPTDTFHHFRIYFDTAVGFSIAIDGIRRGGTFAFLGAPSTINWMDITTHSGDANYMGAVDGIGCSWIHSYTSKTAIFNEVYSSNCYTNATSILGKDSVYQLYDGSASAKVRLEYNVSALSSGSYGYWIYPTSTNAFFIDGEDNSGNIGMEVYFYSDLLFVSNGGSAITVSSAPNSNWYFLMVEFDCSTQTYNVSLDNTIVALNYAFHSASATEIDKIVLESDNTQSGYLTYAKPVFYSWVSANRFNGQNEWNNYQDIQYTKIKDYFIYSQLAELGNISIQDTQDYNGSEWFITKGLAINHTFQTTYEYMPLNLETTTSYNLETSMVGKMGNQSQFYWILRNENFAYVEITLDQNLTLKTRYNDISWNITTIAITPNSVYPFRITMRLDSSTNLAYATLQYLNSSTIKNISVMANQIPTNFYWDIGYTTIGNTHTTTDYIMAIDSNYVLYSIPAYLVQRSSPFTNYNAYFAQKDSNYSDNRILTVYDIYAPSVNQFDWSDKHTYYNSVSNFTSSYQREFYQTTFGSAMLRYVKINTLQLTSPMSTIETQQINFTNNFEVGNWVMSTAFDMGSNAEATDTWNIKLRIGNDTAECLLKDYGYDATFNFYNGSGLQSTKNVNTISLYPSRNVKGFYITIFSNDTNDIKVYFGGNGWQYYTNLTYQDTYNSTPYITITNSASTPSYNKTLIVYDYYADTYTNYVANNWNGQSIPEILKMKYSGTQSVNRIFTKPSLSKPTYFHRINSMEITLALTNFNDMDNWINSMETSNSTIVFSNGSGTYLYGGGSIFNYSQYDTYSANLYIQYDLWNITGISRLTSYQFSVNWLFYYQPPKQSIFDFGIRMLAPIAILILFPYVFYTRWGGKGGAMGFIFGAIVLGVSAMISYIYMILIIIVSIALAIVIFKKKGGELD